MFKPQINSFGPRDENIPHEICRIMTANVWQYKAPSYIMLSIMISIINETEVILSIYDEKFLGWKIRK